MGLKLWVALAVSGLASAGFVLTLSGWGAAPLMFARAGEQSAASNRLVPQIPHLLELAWIDPSADRAAVLTSAPPACLLRRSQMIDAGDALFNSPLLLGGQAAKAGLSCGACHRNGRGHEHFHFSGLSGAPGTVDVSHGFFGPDREDWTENPVPIPDLVERRQSDLLDRGNAEALRRFLSGQITEEFQGPDPASETLDALVAYLKALDPSACDESHAQTVRWQTEIDRVRAAWRMAGDATDPNPFRIAARSALGRIHDRLPENRFGPLRADIRGIAVALESAPYSASVLDRLADRLAHAEPDSFYNRATLTIALDDALAEP